MAERPVFLPTRRGAKLVQTVQVEFQWHAGMSPTQKKKNVVELHTAARKIGIGPLLETSSKSDLEAGRRLSAFHLTYDLDGIRSTVESVFQGSKVFERGGPFEDLYQRPSRESKLDPRLQDSGKLVAFEYLGRRFPLSPPSVFYDWLYVRALYPYRDWLRRLSGYRGFTDIEFNPQRSINCQARACALFVSLQHRGYLEIVSESFEDFFDLESSGML